jgi:hypothetical protein
VDAAGIGVVARDAAHVVAVILPAVYDEGKPDAIYNCAKATQRF